MLYFSETAWTLPDMAEVNQEFDSNYDQGEFARKIPESSATFNERRYQKKARSAVGIKPYAFSAVKITTSSF